MTGVKQEVAGTLGQASARRAVGFLSRWANNMNSEEEPHMSPSGAVASSDIITGPLEQSYRARSAAFRAASDSTRVTRTHWHIAIANGLGWGFDGMDGVIFALMTPLIIKDFGITVPEYRSGMQIALLVGILGMSVRPWLADRYG